VGGEAQDADGEGTEDEVVGGAGAAVKEGVVAGDQNHLADEGVTDAQRSGSGGRADGEGAREKGRDAEKGRRGGGRAGQAAGVVDIAAFLSR